MSGVPQAARLVVEVPDLSVKLRLRRMGSTNRPYYRVVAIDERMRRDGRCVEELGSYDPLKRPAVVNLKEEPILTWLGRVLPDVFFRLTEVQGSKSP